MCLLTLCYLVSLQAFNPCLGLQTTQLERFDDVKKRYLQKGWTIVNPPDARGALIAQSVRQKAGSLGFLKNGQRYRIEFNWQLITSRECAPNTNGEIEISLAEGNCHTCVFVWHTENDPSKLSTDQLELSSNKYVAPHRTVVTELIDVPADREIAIIAIREMLEFYELNDKGEPGNVKGKVFTNSYKFIKLERSKKK
jgi:hypothetical protein